MGPIASRPHEVALFAVCAYDLCMPSFEAAVYGPGGIGDIVRSLEEYLTNEPSLKRSKNWLFFTLHALRSIFILRPSSVPNGTGKCLLKIVRAYNLAQGWQRDLWVTEDIINIFFAFIPYFPSNFAEEASGDPQGVLMLVELLYVGIGLRRSAEDEAELKSMISLVSTLPIRNISTSESEDHPYDPSEWVSRASRTHLPPYIYLAFPTRERGLRKISRSLYKARKEYFS